MLFQSAILDHNFSCSFSTLFGVHAKMICFGSGLLKTSNAGLAVVGLASLHDHVRVCHCLYGRVERVPERL